jgi:hypothetical protein
MRVVEDVGENLQNTSGVVIAEKQYKKSVKCVAEKR